MSEYKSKAKVTAGHLTDVWRETNTNLRAELDECKRQLAAHRASDADELAKALEPFETIVSRYAETLNILTVRYKHPFAAALANELDDLAAQVRTALARHA